MMNRLFLTIYCFALTITCFAQNTAQAGQQDARQIMEKAMTKVGTGRFAIYFEALGYGLTKPQDIFTLPAYKVYKGGYFFNDNNRFELSTGIFKGVSDGSIMVFINEEEKSMVIDSIRTGTPTGEEPTMEMFRSLLPGVAADQELVYDGKETLKGTACHRIKTQSQESQAIVSYYYVSVKDSRLVMMADYHDKKYDVYWIKKIASPPAAYTYTVKIPRHEVSKLYGYEVYDMRFMVSQIR